MLKELHLEWFRRFSEHRIQFGKTTLLVGPNNAGKSTVVEALRLVALVMRYAPNLTFSPVPEWAELPIGSLGVRPRLRDRGFDLRGAIHLLGEPPATIQALFESGVRVDVLVGPDQEVFATLRGPNGSLARSKADARLLTDEQIAIQPQVAPLVFEEGLRDTDYLRRYDGSARAPQHFRNQLLAASPADFAAFASLAEQSWPGLQIKDLYQEDGVVHLIVRDRGFASEASTMGHGLQMWLQTMWFLVRSADASTVILDEPDVYMHADLQRGLIRRLRGRHSQVIIATHSVEIMSEVEPEQVVIIDSSAESSRPAADLGAVQQVVERMGGVHNLQLARMWNARRVLLVEGDDLSLLEQFYATLRLDVRSLATSPAWSIGGWGGFRYAIGSSMAFSNSAGESIRTYCLLDRDFHLDDEITARYQQAARWDVQLHVWSRKEIENYLLVPSAIARLIERRARRGTPPTSEIVAEFVDNAAQELRQDVRLAFVDAHADYSGPSKSRSRDAAAYAERRVEEVYSTPASRISFCPGKTVLRRVRRWAQDDYGVSLSAHAIASALTFDEIPEEVREVLTAIANVSALPAFANSAS